MKKRQNRRTFLGKSMGLFAASAPLAASETETVKLLTPDGELVEVDKTVLDQRPRTQAGKKEILRWSNQIKT